MTYCVPSRQEIGGPFATAAKWIAGVMLATGFFAALVDQPPLAAQPSVTPQTGFEQSAPGPG